MGPGQKYCADTNYYYYYCCCYYYYYCCCCYYYYYYYYFYIILLLSNNNNRPGQKVAPTLARAKVHRKVRLRITQIELCRQRNSLLESIPGWARRNASFHRMISNGRTARGTRAYAISEASIPAVQSFYSPSAPQRRANQSSRVGAHFPEWNSGKADRATFNGAPSGGKPYAKPRRRARQG